jgi:hypothetical protein
MWFGKSFSMCKPWRECSHTQAGNENGANVGRRTVQSDMPREHVVQTNQIWCMNNEAARAVVAMG